MSTACLLFYAMCSLADSGGCPVAAILRQRCARTMCTNVAYYVYQCGASSDVRRPHAESCDAQKSMRSRRPARSIARRRHRRDAHTLLLRRRPAIGVRRRRRREALVRLAFVDVEPPQYILAHLVRVVVVAPRIEMLRDVVERLDDERVLFS